MSIFGKPIDKITAEDIADLTADGGVPESYSLEFKRDLPAKQGKPDPWYEKQQRIGDKAKHEIAEELIAFANSHGGALVLGVEETDGVPSRAKKITPIPACEELAERLRQSLRDLIEPDLPMLEVRGVPIKKAGAGVVVLRVPNSRLAPHRLIPNGQCYFRVETESRKMSMRQIQDKTLILARGTEAVEKRLRDFKEAFGLVLANQPCVWGVRVSLLPTTLDLTLPKIHGNEDLMSVWKSVIAIDAESGQSAPLPAPVESLERRPLIRGARLQHGDPKAYMVYGEAYEDACVNYLLIAYPGWFVEGRTRCLYLSWYVSLVANAIATAWRLRDAAGGSQYEYLMEIELTISSVNTEGRVLLPHIKTKGLVVRPYFMAQDQSMVGRLPIRDRIFPHYPIRGRSGLNEIFALVDRDLRNAALDDRECPIRIDLESLLGETKAE